MSKLYEARKCTLTKPLSKEEIGYVYNSCNLTEYMTKRTF